MSPCPSGGLVGKILPRVRLVLFMLITYAQGTELGLELGLGLGFMVMASFMLLWSNAHNARP